MNGRVARFEARECVEITIQPRVDEVGARVRVAQVATARTPRVQEQHAPLFGLCVGDAHAGEVELGQATEVQLKRGREIALEVIGQLEVDVLATEQGLREVLLDRAVQEKAQRPISRCAIAPQPVRSTIAPLVPSPGSRRMLVRSENT